MFLHVAFRPTPRGVNPPRATYQSPALVGKVVRLECPDELDGIWDGPIYAKLLDTQMMKASDPSPFCREDIVRPAWRCSLTFVPPGSLDADLVDEQRVYLVDPVLIPFWRFS